MKVIIVYDSVFGNTKQVAYAMYEGFKKDEAVICHVNDAEIKDVMSADVMIIGSPTRAFKPTNEITKFLKSLPANSLKGKDVGVFDTRIALEDADSGMLNMLVKLFGYADDTMIKIIKKKGGKLAAPGQGFFVKDSEGPLKDDELKHAKEWVKKIK